MAVHSKCPVHEGNDVHCQVVVREWGCIFTAIITIYGVQLIILSAYKKYWALGKLLKLKILSRNTLILSVLMYGAENRTFSNNDVVKKMIVFKIRTVRLVFGPGEYNGMCWIRRYQELRTLYK